MSRPTVIDLFCGAGGFSEGFRQQGFEILAGYDHWGPAVDTFGYNFGRTRGVYRNILDFEKNIELIETIPDSNVILGSPPCVSFSLSNNSGKADKSLGIRLTKTFLRIVAIKKYKRGSILKAWFMENVKQSIDHIARDYTFKDLNLTDWAKKNKLNPFSIAITLTDNHAILNAADYGSPQKRIRAIAGEIISKKKLIIPPTQFAAKSIHSALPAHLTLREIRERLPAPNSDKKGIIIDPLYKNIELSLEMLTDQFYDTGLYESEWRSSEYQKRNHPYMGRMSFPENEQKPSRTITATKIGTSREAIIYHSEYLRKGHGEYRTPTVRESACLMSFPITYQFIGSESTKCRLVGNAVCPSVSRALAMTVREEMNLPVIKNPLIEREMRLDETPNLNTFTPRIFNTPPIKKAGARFRRHPFKDGNITVTLSNYDITKQPDEQHTQRWITSVQYGNGNGFPSKRYPDGYYNKLEDVIKTFEKGADFLKVINNGFSERIANKKLLQKILEDQQSQQGFSTPIELISEIKALIESIPFDEPNFSQGRSKIFLKEVVPKKQVLALYAVNKICTITNSATEKK